LFRGVDAVAIIRGRLPAGNQKHGAGAISTRAPAGHTSPRNQISIMEVDQPSEELIVQRAQATMAANQSLDERVESLQVFFLQIPRDAV
jgi:hypothetical protein